MEVKLENLIEKIRKDGVEEANHQSEAILKKANNEAEVIINNANKQAKQIISDAQKKAEQFKKNGEKAIVQSARDTVLLIKEKLTNLFDQIFKKEIDSTLKPDLMKELILKIVEQWKDRQDIEIVIGEDDKKQLEKLLFSNLKAQVKDTITIRVHPEIESGFKIGLKNDELYYDFTNESIYEMIKMYLSSNIKAVLDQNNG